LSQVLVFEVVRVNELKHCVPKQERILPVIEAPCHFVQIGLKMLSRNPMPCANNSALEQREVRFHSICMNVSLHIDPALVLNGFVWNVRHSSFLQRVGISRELIGNEHVNISANILFDVACQCAGLCILSMEEAETATTLPNTYNNFFLILAIPHAFAMLLSADIGFVYFDGASHLFEWRGIGHCVPDSVEEIPSCAVINAEHPLKLVRTHTLAGLAKQIYGKKPFCEREMCIVEDRASS